MRFRFFIIDDDPSSRKMLYNAIEYEDLGDVVGEAEDGFGAEASIILKKCDIVLIDLLMPKQDGIETISRLQEMGYEGKFIMISQVEHKEMIAEAYSKGVEYFINKPINRIEVISVIKKVMEHIRLERSLEGIRHTLSLFDTLPKEPPEIRTAPFMRSVLADFGILGETGSQDIILLIEYLLKRYRNERVREFPPLKDIFTDYVTYSNAVDVQREVKAMEQRIRRAVARALQNIASLGLEDYGNPKFELYASKYFDFADVRQKMREIEQNEEASRVRLNVKKFIFTLYIETKEHT